MGNRSRFTVYGSQLTVDLNIKAECLDAKLKTQVYIASEVKIFSKEIQKTNSKVSISA